MVAGITTISAEPLRIVSYNVENLFHPKHDTVMVDSTVTEKDDWAWTPNGERRWSYTRYYRKVESIARVLTNAGGWNGIDIAGLQEVENAECVKRLCHTLRKGEYGFVHYESPDRRGIDVALIYKKARIDTLATKAIPVPQLETRDILYVCAKTAKQDTLHLFVCHLPSQRGGAAESEWKRKIAKHVLQSAVDSLYTQDPQAKIIIMGDFNGTPKDDITGMRNRMNEHGRKLQRTMGTHKYQGQWTCLDQFYTSPAVDTISKVWIYDAEWLQEEDEKYLGLKPKRMYNGFRYQKDGFSDHLPIVLEIEDSTR